MTSGSEQSGLVSLVPDFYYDVIARLPAGAVAVAFVVLATNRLTDLRNIVLALEWAPAIVLLIITLFVTYTLGVLLSGFSFFLFAWWSRPLTWRVVKWWSKDFIDISHKAWSINCIERRLFAQSKGNVSLTPVLSKQRAEMALTTNLCSAIMMGFVVDFYKNGGLPGSWCYWALALLVLMAVMCQRTYTYLEAVTWKQEQA